jgi:hypothetical protein
MIGLAENAEEYNVCVKSSLRPRKALMDIGSVEDAMWQPWPDAFGLDFFLRVRSSTVYVHYDIEGEQDASSSDHWNLVDMDCSDNGAVGLFSHPESPEPIRIPNAGCARAWIEVTYGKWLYPRLKDGSVKQLDRRATDLVCEVFQGDFIEACTWG